MATKDQKEIKNLDLAQKAMREMMTICQIPSPTGYTHNVEAYLMERLTSMGFHPWQRHKGGIICALDKNAQPQSGKAGENALMLSAHIDTLGLMVRHIKGNGRLRLTALGGYPLNYAEQENVKVITRDGREYDGTVRLMNPAVHASRDSGTRARDDANMELVLDEQVHNREDVEALGISAGDFVVLDPRTQLAGDGFLKSRHLDDKASSAMLLALAEEIAAGRIKPSRKLYVMFTNYEEVGHGAAGGIPEGISDLLAVDMGVVGDDLDTDEYCLSICAKDSSGPYNFFFTNELIELAQKNDLRYAVDIYPFYGSDAAAALHSGLDIRHALIGTGVAASHGYERVHQEGVANTLSLLFALAEA
ncbi:MAG: M42 family metallopeptidase [Eubacteriales bacterium]|nr:M42 family metallopeptidase [Eubacteriales bacterium]